MFFEKMQTRKNDGFTLVELIVVIAILAILAGIAVPAYSGYIEKANVAADEQLLHAVNTAFLSACSYKGVDVSSLTSGTAVMPLNAGVVNADGVKPAEATATFKEFYGDNSTSAFKTITSLYFDTNTLAFKAGSGAYLSLVGKFSQTDIDNYNKGFFAEIGFDSLMAQVDMATQVALAADPNSTLGKLVFDENDPEKYMANLATYLGYDLNNDEDAEKFGAIYEEMITKKVNQLIANGADVSTDEGMEAVLKQAEKEIMANTAVLNAATNTTFDTQQFMNDLAAGKGKDTIKNSMDNVTGNGVALSQTAMAYALYTSYIERQGGTPSDNYMEVLDVLATDGFKNYISNNDGTEENEANTDLNSYLAAMNMMNTVSKGEDKTPISNLLVNGFNDPELIAALTQEVSK